jgi:hypothetical protein
MVATLSAIGRNRSDLAKRMVAPTTFASEQRPRLGEVVEARVELLLGQVVKSTQTGKSMHRGDNQTCG